VDRVLVVDGTALARDARKRLNHPEHDHGQGRHSVRHDDPCGVVFAPELSPHRFLDARLLQGADVHDINTSSPPQEAVQRRTSRAHQRQKQPIWWRQ
jgi:hypothetical protein